MKFSRPVVLARIAAGQRPDITRSKLNRVSARELDTLTGYKAEGLTATEERDEIYAEGNRQQTIHAERRANARPLLPEEGRILRLMREKKGNLKKTAQAFQDCRPLLTAQRLKGKGSTRIGRFLFRGVEVVNWNHDRYSRSWHREYGGAREVSERRVEMLQVNRLGSLEVVDSLNLSGFRGNWLIRAIAELLEIKPVRVQRNLKPIQMGEFFNVSRVRRLDGVEIFVRTFGDVVVDYCAVADEQNYHGETPRNAVRGLRRKVLAQRTALEKADAPFAGQDAELLSAKTAEALGFCPAGVAAFCDYNELSIDGTYSRGELRRVVARRRAGNEATWGAELKAAGLLGTAGG